MSVQQGSNSNVLPDVCIICKRKTSYIRDKVCFAKGCYFSQFKTITSHNAVLDVIIFFVKLLFRARTRKTSQDKMHQEAETIDCGRLRETAESKNDESIVIHIRDKDCVAIEVKYHNR